MAVPPVPVLQIMHGYSTTENRTCQPRFCISWVPTRILNDRFVAAPELAGTTWTFIGGYVQGKQMTEDQTNEVLSQLDNEYAFYFDENGAVSLTEGTDTVTAGTYTISEDGMLASISMDNDIKYAGSFIEQDDGPVMVALLDGTGMNALYFHLVVEG